MQTGLPEDVVAACVYQVLAVRRAVCANSLVLALCLSCWRRCLAWTSLVSVAAALLLCCVGMVSCLLMSAVRKIMRWVVLLSLAVDFGLALLVGVLAICLLGDVLVAGGDFVEKAGIGGRIGGRAPTSARLTMFELSRGRLPSATLSLWRDFMSCVYPREAPGSCDTSAVRCLCPSTACGYTRPPLPSAPPCLELKDAIYRHMTRASEELMSPLPAPPGSSVA